MPQIFDVTAMKIHTVVVYNLVLPTHAPGMGVRNKFYIVW